MILDLFYAYCYRIHVSPSPILRAGPGCYYRGLRAGLPPKATALPRHGHRYGRRPRVDPSGSGDHLSVTAARHLPVPHPSAAWRSSGARAGVGASALAAVAVPLGPLVAAARASSLGNHPRASSPSLPATASGLLCLPGPSSWAAVVRADPQSRSVSPRAKQPRVLSGSPTAAEVQAAAQGSGAMEILAPPTLPAPQPSPALPTPTAAPASPWVILAPHPPQAGGQQPASPPPTQVIPPLPPPPPLPTRGCPPFHRVPAPRSRAAGLVRVLPQANVHLEGCAGL